MAILLIMLLTSCVSTKTEVKTVVPDLDFPKFPQAERIENKGETCEVDSEWIVNLAEFSIRYTEVEADYKAIKQLYEGQ